MALNDLREEDLGYEFTFPESELFSTGHLPRKKLMRELSDL